MYMYVYVYIVYPEDSGNRSFQSLGELIRNPNRWFAIESDKKGRIKNRITKFSFLKYSPTLDQNCSKFHSHGSWDIYYWI